jgi:hypothetical protein
MSIYQTYNSNLPNYELPLDNIQNGPGMTNRDIDRQVVYTDVNNNNFYDYDVTNKPTLSGNQMVLPTQLDNGVPQYDVNPDTGEVQLHNMIIGDSITSLGNMIDTVNNGRVSNVNLVNEKFIEKEADIVINKNYKENSIKGILEENILTNNFFSEINIDAIRQMIRYNVYKYTDKIIGNQPNDTLFIIMRSIMLQYGNFQVKGENLIEDIQILNKRVVDYCSENISSNVQQYFGYLDDLEKLPIPMDRPGYHNKQNYTYDISNLL